MSHLFFKSTGSHCKTTNFLTTHADDSFSGVVNSSAYIVSNVRVSSSIITGRARKEEVKVQVKKTSLNLSRLPEKKDKKH